MLSLAEFCERHGACYKGREWASETCSDMPDAWHKAPGPIMVWIATRRGVLPLDRIRLLLTWLLVQVRDSTNFEHEHVLTSSVLYLLRMEKPSAEDEAVQTVLKTFADKLHASLMFASPEYMEWVGVRTLACSVSLATFEPPGDYGNSAIAFLVYVACRGMTGSYDVREVGEFLANSDVYTENSHLLVGNAETLRVDSVSVEMWRKVKNWLLTNTQPCFES